MASELLQSMQFGANLYDRAQTQRRMVDQLNLQVADQVMRQKTADLQNQMQQMAMADNFAEKDFQVEEAPAFYKLQNDIQSYLSDSKLTTPFPAIPQFKSKVFRGEASKAQDGLQQYSARAFAEKQRSFLREQQQTAIRNQTKQLSDEVDFALANGNSANVANLVNGGLLDTGAPDPAVLSQLQQLNAPVRLKQSEAKAKALDTLTEQRLVGGLAGVKAQIAVEQLQREGLVRTGDPVSEGDAFRFFVTGAKTAAGDIKAVNTADSAVQGLSRALEKSRKFEATYGPGSFEKYVGPYDARVFNAKLLLKNVASEDEAAAKDVMREIDSVIQNYRRGLYGSALTGIEKASFERLASSVERGDYLMASGQLRDIIGKAAGTIVERNKFTPQIDVSVKRRYAPQLFNTDSSPSSETNAPAPGVIPDGWIFTP